MTADRQAGEDVRAVAALAEWAAGLCWEQVPEAVRQRLLLVVQDTIAVTAAGHRLPENVALCAQWPGVGADGPSPLFGSGQRAGVDAAAWLNGVAAVSLELDEGNKYARGHPAGHGFPAVLAAAGAVPADGARLCTALLVAYEVASRFGRATSLRAGAHPHGSWGVPGAAAGVATLLGLPVEQVAAAIDTGAGLAIAAPFASALDGNPVRNAWLGNANTSGIAAARMAAAGVARATATATASLGGVLGNFTPANLTDALGERYDVTLNYFKRHAACSYTHPPADAILQLRAEHPDLRASDVTAVLVETHSLAAGLDRTHPPSRLAAMFSLPHVVALALVRGVVDPDGGGATARADRTLAELADRVKIVVAPDLEARLGPERPARVTVTTTDGRTLQAELPNPVGDADFHPFTAHDVADKARTLTGDEFADRLAGAVHSLPDAPSAAAVLDPLA